MLGNEIMVGVGVAGEAIKGFIRKPILAVAALAGERVAVIVCLVVD
jgi:hypothetical protein